MPSRVNTPSRKVTTAEIRSYYRRTIADYTCMWLNGVNLSMHFGYGQDGSTGHAESLLEANRVLADLAGIGDGDRVLDAGCGLGGTSLWLAEAKRVRATGIALGADQIILAKRETRRRSLAVQFFVADFTMLPFEENAFDVVWAHESLCHASDKLAFFKEAARVLSPGGRVLVADFMLRRAQRDGRDQLMLEQWFDGWKLAGLWTAAQHAEAAGIAGFHDVCIQDFTPHTIASHRRLYHRARQMFPLEMALYMAGIRAPVQHGNFIAALRQYQTLRRDCWFYGVFLARKR